MKIVSIETAIEPGARPLLVFCRVRTESGVTGVGESYYIPSAVAATIHEWIAPRLLGSSALDTESHWRFLFERGASFGAHGAELRALSAVDLALWDIKGKVLDRPIWALLGGKTQPRVRIYNSSGGPSYGAAKNLPPWPGYGEIGEPGPLNDYWAAINQPADYAKSLLEEGIGALKIWPLDFAAHKPGGPLYVHPRDLARGLAPFFKIRETVGDQIELILDGHGFFQLPMALRIADSLKEVRPLWLEDVVRPDCVDTICDFRRRCASPVAVSEMLITPEQHRLVLEKRATDYLMVDPTWVGGISQTVKSTDLAQSYNIPVVMHDCTGPLTLLAGVHVGVARANVAWQETVRSHLRTRYPRLISPMPSIVEGHILPPELPGLGTELNSDLFENSATVRVSAV
jgi:L-alanine-DL-glutamate epimerase-like enolase superfamily enzyme